MSDIQDYEEYFINSHRQEFCSKLISKMLAGKPCDDFFLFGKFIFVICKI